MAILERHPENGKIIRASGRQLGAKDSAAGLAGRRLKLILSKDTRYDQLHLMVKKAVEKLEKDLDSEDGYRGAMYWILEHTHLPVEKAPLTTLLPGADTSTFEGVIEAGAAIVDGLLRGEVAVGQAERSIGILKNYAQLRLGEELEKLKGVLEAIEAAQNKALGDTTTQTLPDTQLPVWGRLGGKVPRDMAPKLSDDDEAELLRNLLE